jgi:hypothetical protein
MPAYAVEVRHRGDRLAQEATELQAAAAMDFALGAV